MEPKLAEGQEVYTERVRNSVAKHLAAQRATLTNLIDAQLTQMHKTLLDQMEADLLAALLSSREIASAPQTLNPEDNPLQPDQVVNNVVAVAERESIDPQEITFTDFNTQEVGTLPSALQDSECLPVRVGIDGVPEMHSKSEKIVRLRRHKDLASRLIGHPAFEAFFMGAILANTMVAALYGQYRSFDIGERINYHGVRNGPDTWPSGKDAFVVLEYVFTALYTIEIVIKFAALQCLFWRSRWNVFDFTLVAFWYLNVITNFAEDLNPTMLRLCRLVRLMRVIRHAGWFEGLDSLHMLLTAMYASFSILLWSVLLLTAFFGLAGLITNASMIGYLEDPDGDPIKQREVYKYFGSFSRSFISMFEMAFHNHAPIMRQIMEKVDEKWAIYFLIYKCLVGLSVMKVITGVFLHETFKVCSEDDELMIIQKKRAVRTHTQKMTKLFTNLNDDGSSTLTWDEFQDVMADDWVKTWLNAQGLDTSNAERLWFLLDTSGDGELTAEELVKGVAKLKGAATSIDMNHVVAALGDLKCQINAMNTQLISYDEKIQKDEADILRVVSEVHVLEGIDPAARPKSPSIISATPSRRQINV